MGFLRLVVPALLAALPPAFADDLYQPELPPMLPWRGASLALVAAPDDPWVTPAERAGFVTTPRYAETVAWLQRLVEAAPELHLLSLGDSPEGRAIWMVVASKEGGATPAALAANGRPTLLVQAGIHSGEIDGKDAGLMLLRDLTVRGTRAALLEDANLLFVPILNVDGHERVPAAGRINQRGPAGAGWRSNRRNLNLNRDYAKLQTPELRALVAAIVRWSPDLYIDLHVTDGVDYRYDVTFGYNGPHAWSPRIAGWLERELEPALLADLEEAGHHGGPLIFASNRRDFSAGIDGWTASPRYSNGYGDARHLPTVLVENHSLKPYARRVLGTYVLLASALRTLGREHAALAEAVRRDRAARRPELVLGWRIPVLSSPESVFLDVIESQTYHSPITGDRAVRWTGRPRQAAVEVHTQTEPTVSVTRPAHYYLPAAWADIGEVLRAHGIEVERLSVERRLRVEMYRLPGAATAATPYEGRVRVEAGTPRRERRELTLAPGSLVVSTDQPLGDLAMLLLEPQSPDSLFQWGFFLEVLSRTEYVEGYVMEPMAQRMLARDPDLLEAFRARLAGDPAFAADPRARLQWFYRRTPFYDDEHRLYPVARSIAAD